MVRIFTCASSRAVKLSFHNLIPYRLKNCARFFSADICVHIHGTLFRNFQTNMLLTLGLCVNYLLKLYLYQFNMNLLRLNISNFQSQLVVLAYLGMIKGAYHIQHMTARKKSTKSNVDFNSYLFS